MMLIKNDFSQLEKNLLELTQKVIEQTELELYDFEYIKGSRTLRVYVCEKESKNAVIEDCVEVDRAFTPFVEEADWIPEDFVLEVSSPGVYRNLKTKEHFDQAMGQRIEVKLKPGKAASYNNKKKFDGVLLAFDEEKMNLKINNDEVEIKFDDVLKANLNPEF
jgi:ribosome maturation factor RimP